jgi:hypothetical protein
MTGIFAFWAGWIFFAGVSVVVAQCPTSTATNLYTRTNALLINRSEKFDPAVKFECTPAAERNDTVWLRVRHDAAPPNADNAVSQRMYRTFTLEFSSEINDDVVRLFHAAANGSLGTQDNFTFVSAPIMPANIDPTKPIAKTVNLTFTPDFGGYDGPVALPSVEPLDMLIEIQHINRFAPVLLLSAELSFCQLGPSATARFVNIDDNGFAMRKRQFDRTASPTPRPTPPSRQTVGLTDVKLRAPIAHLPASRERCWSEPYHVFALPIQREFFTVKIFVVADQVNELVPDFAVTPFVRIHDVFNEVVGDAKLWKHLARPPFLSYGNLVSTKTELNARGALETTAVLRTDKSAPQNQLLVLMFTEIAPPSFAYSIAVSPLFCLSHARPVTWTNTISDDTLAIDLPSTRKNSVNPFLHVTQFEQATAFEALARSSQITLCPTSDVEGEVILHLEPESIFHDFATLVIEVTPDLETAIRGGVFFRSSDSQSLHQ